MKSPAFHLARSQGSIAIGNRIRGELPHPDMVGRSEYWAIHDMLVTQLYRCESRIETLDHLISCLSAFEELAQGLQAQLETLRDVAELDEAKGDCDVEVDAEESHSTADGQFYFTLA